jgi:hypothetical protein
MTPEVQSGRVWCDGCGKPLDGAFEFTSKSDADRAALAAGWTVCMNRDAHLCPPCDVKAVADAEARGMRFIPMEVN